jgi:SAM-dependent methyltransferase
VELAVEIAEASALGEETTMAASAPPIPDATMREWKNFACVFDKLGPPLRPTPGDVANVESGISGFDEHVLLLGVTPELSVLGKSLVAIDNSPRMIERVWPGDTERRRAMIGDWTELPFDSSTFDAVIGDGAFNAAPDVMEQVLGEIRRVLRPGGRAALRLFCSPETPETLRQIQRDPDRGSSDNVHAMKWRIAMSLAAATPNAVVSVRKILEAFNGMFPDRDRLACRTGWSVEDIGTLDAYADADHSLAFPTLGQILNVAGCYLGQVGVLRGARYPLADRCPTIVWER